MDTTKTTTHLGLCAGYGGIELGLKRVIPNLRSVALCEIEAFACANLVAKMEAGLMEPAPIWTDLKTFPWESFRDRVDILTGGYPCQPFSAAGKRLGTEDPRHLWPFIADGIRILRPKLCFFENVEGHISLGLREVVGELESIGYTAAWGIFSASEVGAPHQRKRVFILAYRICDGYDWRELQDRVERWSSGELPQPHAGEPCGVWSEASGCGQVWPSRPGEPQHGWEPPRVVCNSSGWSNGQQPTEQQGWNTSGRSGEESGTMGNATSQRSCGGSEDGANQQSEMLGTGYEAMVDASDSRRDNRDKGQQSIQESCRGCGENNATDAQQTQPPLGRDADGPAGGMDYAELCVTCDNRTDELRLLGNGVVPATAERAFLTLIKELNT